MEKKDYLIMAWIAILVCAIWIAWYCFWGDRGSEVEIINDNGVIYSCSLYKEKYLFLKQGFLYETESEKEAIELFENDESITNVIVIKYGHAEVSLARCPDQICVDSLSIDKSGQSIVCMPNKIALYIK